MKSIITTSILFLTLIGFCQTQQLKKIDSILNSKISEDDPGLMVGIVKDGEIIYEKYRGIANLSYMIKMDETTRSNIASAAKQFTALMVLQLSIENKLSLEDDIRTYIPDLYPNVKEDIKIRHLINHTSGIREYIGLMDMQNEAWWQQFGLDNGDILDLMKKQEDLSFKPGSQYSYSNSNYNILAEIIEVVSKTNFKDYAKAFFEDLGMKNTEFPKKYMTVMPNRAEPYSDWGGGEWYQTPRVTKTGGEGFLFTTLKDQLIYEQAVQNAKANNNILLIKSQEPIPDSEIKRYGFGLRLFNWFNGPYKAVHHDGGTNGYKSQTVRFTEENLSIFVMTNNGNIQTDDVANEVAMVFLPAVEETITYSDRLKEPVANKNPQVIGQYRSPKNQLIRVEIEEGKTYYKRGGLSIELIKENEYTYYPYYDSNEKLVFYDDQFVFFDTDGSADDYRRVNVGPASQADLKSFEGSYYSTELDMSLDFWLAEDNTLQVKLSTKSNVRDVEVLNRNELQSRNFTFKVERDAFDRPMDLRVSLGRALNNRFRKKTNLKFQPEIPTENGTIQVTTIPSREGDRSDILLTKNFPNGNEIWSKQFGGKSWDKASSIVSTNDGYLLVGSTSSYGAGNYDVFVIKTDKNGKQQWQNTYGKFYNDYGYTAEATDSGYLIKGTTQICDGNSDINRKCSDKVWLVYIDENGKELSNKILEELK